MAILIAALTEKSQHTVKPVLRGHSKRRPKLVFKTDYRLMEAQWLSGRVLDSRPKGRGFEPHCRHCFVSLSKNINSSLVLVQPRKTCPCLTERLLKGRKESNQTNKQRLSLNAGQKYCRMLQGEHSAIFSTFIKLSFVILKYLVLPIFEWPLKTGFTVVLKKQSEGAV